MNRMISAVLPKNRIPIDLSDHAGEEPDDSSDSAKDFAPQVFADGMVSALPTVTY